MKKFGPYELACELNQKVENLNVDGHLREQLIRAVSSIPRNLAEGKVNSSVKEKCKFYQTAHGLLKECKAIFVITRTYQKDLLACVKRLDADLQNLIKNLGVAEGASSGKK